LAFDPLITRLAFDKTTGVCGNKSIYEFGYIFIVSDWTTLAKDYILDPYANRCIFNNAGTSMEVTLIREATGSITQCQNGSETAVDVSGANAYILAPPAALTTVTSINLVDRSTEIATKIMRVNAFNALAIDEQDGTSHNLCTKDPTFIKFTKWQEL
jgi:hypothetical protein